MILLILSFISALVTWFAVATKNRTIEYGSKPATLLFLILWYVSKLPEARPAFSMYILVGLVLSLIGDIFLMLPGDWFLAGLISFLLGHLAYIAGFNAAGILLEPRTLITALVIIIISTPILLKLISGMQQSGNSSLIIPVILYVIVIAAMVWSASSTLFRDDWSQQAAILATLGAILFYISDAFLGWNRFVKPITQGNLIVIVTYHLAQYLISFGVLYNLGVL